MRAELNECSYVNIIFNGRNHLMHIKAFINFPLILWNKVIKKVPQPTQIIHLKIMVFTTARVCNYSYPN